MTPLAPLLFVLLGFGLGLSAVLVARRIGRRGPATERPVRLVLPLSSSGTQILPNTSVQVTAQPQGDFRIDGLILEDAADWVVNDLLVDEQSQFVQSGDVPGTLFSGMAQGGGLRLSVAPAGSDVCMILTNVGDGPRELRCLALGTLVDDPTLESTRLILPMSSGVSVLPNTSAQITSRPVRHTFRPERLVIHNGKDWVVNEIKTGNRSQFLQSGDVPGSAFDASVPCGLRMESVSPKTDFVLVVTYVGTNPNGAPLVASVVGEATRSRRTPDAKLAPRPPRVALIGASRPDTTMRIVPAA